MTSVSFGACGEAWRRGLRGGVRGSGTGSRGSVVSCASGDGWRGRMGGRARTSTGSKSRRCRGK